MNKQSLITEARQYATTITERELGYLYDDMLTSGCSLQEIAAKWKTHVLALASGRPLQYVTRLAHFYGTTFYVDEAVLIPRPETEELVHMLIQECKSSDITAPRILDVGTGSGCIPITLQMALPESMTTAVDVSVEALTVARKNATAHTVEIDIKQVDFTDPEARSSLSHYDIIVSNPPYIPKKEKRLMHENVLAHEPHVALFVEDEDPLLFYRLVGEFGLSHLASGGLVALELNEYNAQQVASLYESFGYSSVQIHQDLQGKDRILSARLA